MGYKMNLLNLLFILIFIFGCAYEDLSDEDVKSIRGNWTGSGQFDDPTIHNEFGQIEFKISIEKDTVEGNFGDGRFSQAQAGKLESLIHLRIVLDDRIDKDMYCQKDHVVFSMNEIEAEMIRGYFHLKSNFIFDPGTRTGKFVLNRAEEIKK